MKTCYIVGAGDFSQSFTPDKDDLVIAADGGYDHLFGKGIRCDLVVGDLDSIKALPSSVETVRHKVEKDETDMHLCYIEGARRGYERFKIYGGCGGRDDHTFANYCLLLYIREHGGRAELYSDYGRIFVIKDERIDLPAEPDGTVSVFAFGGDAHGVDIRGLYYEVEDITLTKSFPLGVSNHFVGRDAEINVRDGALLVICETRSS